ncbi:MAG: hypothetical protein AABO57_15595 [Acidobacteriota bacterium]
METSHRHSTVSTLLSAFFALTFIWPWVSSLARTKSEFYGEKTGLKINDAVIEEFGKAWRAAGAGRSKTEVVVLLYQNIDGSLVAKSLRPSNEYKQVTFKWDPAAIAVVHTHPNECDAEPQREDRQIADKSRIAVYTITSRGMYVYDPDTKKISMVHQGLDWLESAKWNHDRAVIAQTP